MSLSDLDLPSDVEMEGDVLPSSGGYLLDSGVHNMIIKAAFLGESSGGAKSLDLRLQTADGSRKLNETIYLSSGKAKGCRTYYERNGKRIPLPGYTLANDLAYVTTETQLTGLDAEKKTIKLWNYEAGEEVPTEVDMIMPLVGKAVKVGVVRARENKPVKDGNKWVPGPELKEFNKIQKFFSSEGLTRTEMLAGNTEPVFLPKWEKQHPSDYIEDKFKPVDNVVSESEPAIQTSASADDDLFNDI